MWAGASSCVAALLAAGCYHSTPPPRMTPIEQPVKPDAPVVVEQPDTSLYTYEEVFADIASGPLVYVGTGEWTGMFHVYACAYRNAKVYVINFYCTKSYEKKAFGIAVLSPTRGRAYLYAEADKPISGLRRADYFTYRFEAELNTTPPVSMTFSYDQLHAWDEARYKQYASGCFAGVELRKPVNGCMQKLEEFETSFPDSHRAILENPPEAYYALVRDLRDRAKREGRDWKK
ncbi:MAG TPA: hypothetical protein VMZ53_08530 [Kofleriaceae bacterium]|nr:hypothetical protein [Kofleriaceae bacterium]